MRLTSGRSGQVRSGQVRSGQALVEFALVFPIFVVALFAFIVLGIYVFYNQQLENAAREAARYAALHSTTAQCPTVSHLDPQSGNRPDPYFRCDAPEDGWPRLTAAARTRIWGMAPNQVSVYACWSGFVDPLNNPDAPPMPPNTFVDCTIGGINPQLDSASLSCPPPASVVSATGHADGDDKASAIAFGSGLHFPTTVTVYTCFTWNPPMGGIGILPSQITLRAVVTEAMQRQQ
jgi:hypothetical protein